MERNLYATLARWKTNKDKKPLILYGARQTGKTWLLRHFGNTEFSRLHYINFESDKQAAKLFEGSLSPSKLLPLLELHLNSTISTKSDVLFFDEIQQAPNAVTSLKYFYEERPEIAIVCAGSFIGLYGLPHSFPVGKITALTLYPLSFQEFLKAVDSKLSTFFVDFLQNPGKIHEAVHEKLWNRLTQYYFTGGMPEAVLPLAQTGKLDKFNTDKIIEIQSNLILGYHSDFAKHAGTLNANHIYRLFEQVPGQLSKAVDNGTKRFMFKDAVPGAKRYRDLEGPISWLHTAGLLNICHVVGSNSKPLVSNVKQSMLKLYLHDTGLLHRILGLSATEIISQTFGSYKGFTAENYTAGQLCASGFSELFNWNKNESEIEFLVQYKNLVIPIEVKSGIRTTRAKSLQMYMERYKPKLAIKISGGNYSFDGQVINLPLYAAGNIPEILHNLNI